MELCEFFDLATVRKMQNVLLGFLFFFPPISVRYFEGKYC